VALIGKSFLPSVVPRSAFDIERLRPANQQFSEDERERHLAALLKGNCVKDNCIANGDGDDRRMRSAP
jgi:hypothetical protein